MEPVLQVALDHMHRKRALLAAKEAVEGGADWLEAGTPLIKSEGMEVVRELKKSFPGKTIVADLKTMDTGAFETEIAAKAGADVITVMGVTDDATILEAVKAARRCVDRDRWRSDHQGGESRGRDPDDQEGDARAQGNLERFVQEIHGGGRPRRSPESIDPESRGRDAETRRDDGPRPAHQARLEAGGSRVHREDGGRGLGEAGRGDRPREARRCDRDRRRRRTDRRLGRTGEPLVPREGRGRRRDRRRRAGPRYDPGAQLPLLQPPCRAACRGTERPRGNRERNRLRWPEGPRGRLDRRGRIRTHRRAAGTGGRDGEPRHRRPGAREPDPRRDQTRRHPELRPGAREVGTDPVSPWIGNASRRSFAT